MPDGTKLSEFVAWCAKHITGDEKGEAQLFLDRLFQAFGHAGLKEAGATLEFRVAKDAGGTAFADLVWKPVVLMEMKKRGTDLQKHYRQAFDYWTRLVPNRPRYVVLCNFDEFRVFARQRFRARKFLFIPCRFRLPTKAFALNLPPCRV